MHNNYFQFKQFIVYQDKAAMKVSADAVILGAWTEFGFAKKIIDIGTGTGLLSLMAAQKSQADITAVEIDPGSVEQAKQNFDLSPWKNRIHTVYNSFQKFTLQTTEKFDLAICNPPYFNGSYQSPDKSRNTARQDKLLPLPVLFSGIKKILSPTGKFYIIYPFVQKHTLLKAAEKESFYPLKILEIKTKPGKTPNRIAVCFTTKKSTAIIEQLHLRDELTKKYSKEYRNMTSDFYLNL
jgi:tRNA1Val (adenine37-N6)-methyltransferase